MYSSTNSTNTNENIPMMVRDDIKMELETASSFPTFSSECIALDLVGVDHFDRSKNKTLLPYENKDYLQTR